MVTVFGFPKRNGLSYEPSDPRLSEWTVCYTSLNFIDWLRVNDLERDDYYEPEGAW